MSRQLKELPESPGKPVSVVFDGVDGWAGGETDPIRGIFADLQAKAIEDRERLVAECSKYLAEEAIGGS